MWHIALRGAIRGWAAAALWLLLSTAALSQACVVPDGLRGLTLRLTSLSQTGAMSDSDRLRLQASLDGLGERRVLNQLQEAKLDALVPVALELLGSARRIVDSGRVTQPAALRLQLAEFSRVAALPCDGEGSALFQLIQSLRKGGSALDAGGDRNEVPRDLRQSEHVRPSYLLGIVALTVLLMYAADYGYRWAMALIYNRKMCRIAAALHCGSARVPGLVRTLGRGGCRFQPDHMYLFDTILADLRNSPARLCIHQDDLPVQVSTVHDDHADFRFDEKLTLKHQRALLALSTISPFYAKKARAQPPPDLSPS